MNEEAPVVTPAAQEAAPQSVPEVVITPSPSESASTFADLDAEFNLSAEYPAQQQQAQAQPDIYGKLTELEQRLAQIVPQQQAQQESYEEEPQVKFDGSKIEEDVFKRVIQMQQEQAKNQQIVQGAIQESQAVKADYELKVIKSIEAGGINLEEQPILKELLAESLQAEIQKEQLVKGRMVLSGVEMKQVVARHLQKVKPTIGRLMPNTAKVVEQKPLSAAGIGSQSNSVDKKSAYDSFRQKKEEGTLSMADILKAL